MADDWQTRLAAALAIHTRRRKLREQARAELDRARQYGLEQRHSAKLRRQRKGGHCA